MQHRISIVITTTEDGKEFLINRLFECFVAMAKRKQASSLTIRLVEESDEQ